MKYIFHLHTPNRFRVAIIALLVLFGTTFITNALAVDELTIQVKLDEVRNEFSDDIEYHPTSLILNENNDFCDSGNSCTYDISDGELTQNSYDSTLRSFDGTLKVIIQQGDTKVTKLFPFNAELSISEIRETGGRTIELLDGKIGLGKDTYNPDFEYEFTNGTLTIEGKKATLHLSGNSTGF